jgi:hypothetical protein
MVATYMSSQWCAYLEHFLDRIEPQMTRAVIMQVEDYGTCEASCHPGHAAERVQWIMPTAALTTASRRG